MFNLKPPRHIPTLPNHPFWPAGECLAGLDELALNEQASTLFLAENAARLHVEKHLWAAGSQGHRPFQQGASRPGFAFGGKRLPAFRIGNHGLIGDGLMALFGAPLPLKHCARRAVSSAREMFELIAEFSVERRTVKKPMIKIGFGIATGEVVAGVSTEPLGELKGKADAVTIFAVAVGQRT